MEPSGWVLWQLCCFGQTGFQVEGVVCQDIGIAPCAGMNSALMRS